MITRFKICGVRAPADIDAAVAAGASALGFCFHAASPRSVAVDQAAELAERVPLWVERVALFVDRPADEIRAAAAAIGAGTVQLHGRVPPELAEALRPLRVVLARAAEPGLTAASLSPYLGRVAALLLDAKVAGLHGGTGRQADWSEARRLRDAVPELPLILAGGLTPENVGAAIAAVRPYAVDVASGVESAPGVKDAARIAAFGDAVRRAG